MSKSLKHQDSIRPLLKKRALYFNKVRSFFQNRDVIEVDPPALSSFASIDAYIDPIETTSRKFLHTSPEYAMKRLLAQGSNDIFFLGHVYRKEEFGRLHNSEFSMIEWYRTNTTEERFLQEVLDLISLFLGTIPHEIHNYDDIFLQYQQSYLPKESLGWSLEEKRHYIWACHVEPLLGKDKIDIVTHFRKEDAALSQTCLIDGKEVAKRYELYYKSIELGNGFLELTDSDEQEKRFFEANKKRQSMGKAELPLDIFLLKALKRGLPPHTFGMALGFDRLLMLALGEDSIQTILPLNDEALS